MDSEVLLSIHSISKSFGGTKALDDINMEIRPGEIHCIAGENGAGKSTFIKILTGAYRPDTGTVSMGGRTYSHLTPAQAAKEGIRAIYQENILAEELSVAENVFAGHERTGRGGFISFKKAEEEVKRLAERFGIQVDPHCPVRDLSVAGKQYVKILQALALEPRLLIFDEPTAMLNISDAGRVLELVKTIAAKGTSVIYISHHLAEIIDIAHRITVFRDGRQVSTRSNENRDIPIETITMDMIGRKIEEVRNDSSHVLREELFRVRGLRVDGFAAQNNISVRKGEILGITGMVGSGRTEILEAIFGFRKKEYEEMLLMGKPVRTDSPAEAIAHKIGFISEDRQGTGLASCLSIATNMICNSLEYKKGPFADRGTEEKLTEKTAEELRIKCRSIRQNISELSGGNQQKAIIGRWLIKNFDLLLLDEPTKGVDVGSKADIYQIIYGIAKEGKSVLLVSSDMQEVITICNRVLVLKDGAIISELQGDEITEVNIIKSALGVS